MDDDLSKSLFMASEEATTGARSQLRPDGDSKGTAEHSNTSTNTGSVQTERFLGHAVGGKKKSAVMKRLMMDTVGLIA